MLFNPFGVDIACGSVSRGFTPGFAVGPLRGPDDFERECDWHGQEIGGERRKAQVLSRSPDEGNPTPMRQGR